MVSQTLLIWSNVLAFLLHFGIAVTLCILSEFNQLPTVYASKFSIVLTTDSWTLEPTLSSFSALSVPALLLVCETITALFHLGNACLWRKRYLFCVASKVNPFRWVEYAITASIMAVVISFSSGVREINGLLFSGTNIGFIQLCGGLLTELWNVPLKRERSSGTNRVWARDTVTWRLLPHLFCYPLFILWSFSVIFHFVYGGGPSCAPSFVTIIVVGEVVLFSSFAIPQLYVYSGNPSRYDVGELTYLILSATSKAFLSIVLIVGALQQENFDYVEGSFSEGCALVDPPT